MRAYCMRTYCMRMRTTTTTTTTSNHCCTDCVAVAISSGAGIAQGAMFLEEAGDEEGEHFVHAGSRRDAGAALLAALVPDDRGARLRANRVRSHLSDNGAVIDMLASAVRSQRGFEPSRPARRREQDLLSTKLHIGRRFLVARRLQADHAGWAISWAREEFPERCCGSNGFDRDRTESFLRKARNYSKMVVSKEASSQVVPRGSGQGVAGVCTQAVPFSKRRRVHGAGGPGAMKAMVIADELFVWFVDTIDNIKGRLPSAILLNIARIIANDAKQCFAQQIENGEVGAHEAFECPRLDHGWLMRWRKLHNISWRTPNLRFKCSRELIMHRLRIFWMNILRVRFLHRALSQETGELVFEGFDQKPLWFTAASQEKTLAPRGAVKVVVKENMPMTRSRFTAMTRCRWPSPPEDGKEIAILFKASGRGVRIRPTLRTPPGVLLQFQEKGSYRLEDVLEYLEWIVDRSRLRANAAEGEPASSQRRVVYLLDWFAPHLDPAVDDLVHRMGHAVLRIGGHLTGLVQVEDTHCHGPMTTIYKTRESREAYEQLLVRPDQLPSTSRQTVMDRALDAWMQVNHFSASKGFVSNGITNALDGSEDDILSSDVADFWTALDMPAVRLRAKDEVAEAIASGKVACFEEYVKILEKYDRHAGLTEGQEAFGVEIRGDDEEESGAETIPDADVADDHTAGLEPCASVLAARTPRREVAGAQDAGAQASEEAVITVTPRKSGSEPNRDSAMPAHLSDESVRKDLATPLAKKKSATSAALDACVSAGGDPDLERQLRSRLRTLSAAEARINSPARIHVHAMHLERRQNVDMARAECKAYDAAEKAAAITLKLRQAEAQVAKSMGKKAAAEAKMMHETAKSERAEQLRLRAKANAETDRLRLHFAAYLVGRVQKYMGDTTAGSERVARAAKCAESAAKRRTGLARIDTPIFWEAKTAGLKALVPSGQLVRLRAKREVYWASADFAFELFGKDNTDLDEPLVRLRRLIERTMPKYFVVLGSRYGVDALMAESGGILDLAFVGANWRYTQVVTAKMYRVGLCDWPPADFQSEGNCGAQPSGAQASGAQ